MANIIILEGLSRSGKSSICKHFEYKHNFKYLGYTSKLNIKNKDKISLPDFYYGVHLTMAMFLNSCEKENIILDRSSLSDIIYSNFFNRKTYLTENDFINDTLKKHNFLLVYMSNSYSNYIERSPKETNLYSNEDFVKQQSLFELYFNSIYASEPENYEFKNWTKRFLHVPTNNLTLNETIELIEKNCKTLKIKIKK